MKTHVILTTFVALFGVAELRADFTGYYAFPNTNPNPSGPPSFGRVITAAGTYTSTANNWTIASNNDGAHLQFPRVTVSPIETVFTLESGALLSGFTHFSTVQVTTTAPAAGFLSFDFSIRLGTPSSSHAYYLINGTRFELPAGIGSVTNVPLKIGDVFGFGVNIGPQSTVNQTLADANVQVTNFSAPVPEPSAAALVLLAGGVVALLRHRSCSKTHRTRSSRLARRLLRHLAVPQSV